MVFWHLGGSMDPRFERHGVSQMGWLNRWLLKHPIRGPVIFFVIGGATIGSALMIDVKELGLFSLFPFLLGFFLLIYALIRRAAGITFVEDEDLEEEPPPETYTDVDEQARQQALASWRRRARQDRHQRRNPHR